MPAVSPLAVVVLVSGHGSNLQALMDSVAAKRVPAVIRAVISDRADAFGLERARRAGIPAVAIPPSAHPRRAWEQALAKSVDEFAPGLVVLAGFMRVLSADFVRHYQGRMLNIHPSLLPKYRGLHTHRRVLEAGDREHGASVHFVTEELDGGPVIMQARIAVQENDNEQSLAQRVQALEHVIYPQAVRLFAEGRVRMRNGIVEFDGGPLDAPLPPQTPPS